MEMADVTVRIDETIDHGHRTRIAFKSQLC
jgi:hypothetical protein